MEIRGTSPHLDFAKFLLGTSRVLLTLEQFPCKDTPLFENPFNQPIICMPSPHCFNVSYGEQGDQVFFGVCTHFVINPSTNKKWSADSPTEMQSYIKST